MFRWATSLKDKLTAVVDGKVHASAESAGARMVEQARKLVPVRTGRLKSSIYHEYDPATKTLRLAADAPHALYVEMGTYQMPPRPFLRPAMLAVASRFFTPYKMDVVLGSTMDRFQEPRQIKASVRPSIAAANRKYNRGVVRKAGLETVTTKYRTGGKHRPMTLNRNKLLKSRKAWN